MLVRTLILAILWAAPRALNADAIQVVWNGGTGDWVDPTQWSTGVVPNNGGSKYAVSINSGKPDLVNLLTQNILVDSASVGSQSAIHVNDQGLQLGNPLSSSQMLTNAGTLSFSNAASLTLDYSGGAAAVNSGKISLGDESGLYMNAPSTGSGTLTNTGTIAFENNPHGSQIYLSGDGATFTINGGGAITLSDNAANLISGSYGTENLISDNKMSGAGTIANMRSFTNNGTVTANGVNSLIFNPDYTVGTTNFTGSIINNGSISVVNGSGVLLLGANGDLSLKNTGSIALNGAENSFAYDDANNHHALVLSGNGTLSLGNNLSNFFGGYNGDETLFNEAGHTITGAAHIGRFGGGIINDSSIIANGSAGLLIDVGDAALRKNTGITNNGLIQINDGSSLQLLTRGSTTIVNTGNITLNASASTSSLIFNDIGSGGKSVPGSVLEISGGSLTLSDNPGNQILGQIGDEGLQIDRGAKLSGAGTISNFGGYEGLTNNGTIVASGKNHLILDGTAATAAGFSALSNFGVLQVNDGSNFEFRSSIGMDIHNWSGFNPGGGIITLNAAASTSTLSFNSLGNGGTFFFDQGPGSITMTDNPGNQIVGVSGTESLKIDKLQTISGAGTIGNFDQILNAGAIVASGANHLILSLSPLSAGGLVNSGVIQVNDGATLELRQNVAGVNFVNTGQITLNASTGTSTLAINDQGINQAYVQSGGSSSQPFNALFLRGSGTLTMSNNPGNRIVGVTGDEALFNLSAIEGAGTISNFGAGVINAGGILANGSVPLSIDITAATKFGIPGLVNDGNITIANGSTLQIVSPVGGTVESNSSGNISMGSSFTGNATLSFNDLGKGQTFTLASISAGGSPFAVNGVAGNNRIVGVNGDETLINGVNNTIFGQIVISNFARFVNNGILDGIIDVQAPLQNWNGATGTLTGGTYFANEGAIKLESLGSQTITNLVGANVTLQSGATGTGILTGNGTVNALSGLTNVTNSNVTLDNPLTITPVAGTLTLTNSVLLGLAGSAVTIGGNVSLTSRSALEPVVGGTVSIHGNLFQDATSNIIVGNSSSIAASDFLNNGAIEVDSGGIATFTGEVSNAGKVSITTGAEFSVVKSPFRAFGTNVYIQTAGATKVFTGGVLNAATVDLEGGTLGGGGTINANVVVNGGTFAPGDPTTTDVVGDLTVNAAGEILLDIDGTGPGLFDSVNVTGNVHLNGGTLDIVFENGFVPRNGDLWNLLSFTGAEDGGGFGKIIFENAGGEQLDAFFNGHSFEIGTQNAEETPEPSTIPMLLVLLAGIALWRKRQAMKPQRSSSAMKRGFVRNGSHFGSTVSSAR